MSRTPSPRALFAGSALLFAALVGALGAHGCSNYGEGERCELDSANGGNDDCQDGLVCRNVGTNGARCCPPDPNAAAPGSICGQRQGNVGNDAAPSTPDSGGGSDSGKDAADGAVDAVVDAPSEVGSDSSTDAPTGD